MKESTEENFSQSARPAYHRTLSFAAFSPFSLFRALVIALARSLPTPAQIPFPASGSSQPMSQLPSTPGLQGPVFGGGSDTQITAVCQLLMAGMADMPAVECGTPCCVASLALSPVLPLSLCFLSHPPMYLVPVSDPLDNNAAAAGGTAAAGAGADVAPGTAAGAAAALPPPPPADPSTPLQPPGMCPDLNGWRRGYQGLLTPDSGKPAFCGPARAHHPQARSAGAIRAAGLQSAARTTACTTAGAAIRAAAAVCRAAICGAFSGNDAAPLLAGSKRPVLLRKRPVPPGGNGCIWGRPRRGRGRPGVPAAGDC